MRFWGKVTKTDVCWLYHSTVSSRYGRFWIGSASINAHRVAKLWESKTSHLNHIACHLCPNRNCVLPNHIYWGTPASNAADRITDETSRPQSHQGEFHPLAKLTKPQVEKIYLMVQRGGISAQFIASMFCVTASAVQRIISGSVWSHVTSHLPPMTLTRAQRGHCRGEAHHSARLTTDDAMAIKQRLARGDKFTEIAFDYGVSKAAVQDIKHGRAWAHA